MSEDYLWDRSGPPDPAVARLERTLAPLRWKARTTAVTRSASRGAWRPALAAAALVAVCTALWSHGFRGASTSWEVRSLDGAPAVAGAPVEHGAALAEGEWIETDAASRAHLSRPDVGEVEVGPGSRVRVLASRPREQRLELVRGRIDATIWAPPRLFVVETPAAVAVDLGCAYSLEVDADGAGLLHVRAGWVSLGAGATESIVPAGARCPITPGRGPGVPRFDDAPPALEAALAALEAGRPEALDRALAAARPRDTLSLWHLLPRVAPDARSRVVSALEASVARPPGVSAEAAITLDRAALGAWREALEATWW